MDKKINARKKAQRLARQRKMRNRRIALTICLMVAVCLASVGGTLAWITANTAPVVNTFTVGNIKLDLYEHVSANATEEIKANSLEIIPGNTLYKDPTVEVQATSEPCWLFVKVEKANWTEAMNEKVTYAIDDAVWTQLAGVDGVYYKKIETETTVDAVYNVLKDKQVVVANTLTKTEVEAVGTGANAPKLTFTAYACQLANVADAAAAWKNIIDAA